MACWSYDDEPHIVPGFSGAASIAGSFDSMCAVLRDGVLRCQGRHSAADGLAGVRAIDLGSDFGCALHVDGTVSCWGDNTDGQLAEQSVSDGRPALVVTQRE